MARSKELACLKQDRTNFSVFGISIDPSTWEAEAGGSLLSSRPAWSRLFSLPSQLELYSEMLSQEQQKRSNPNTSCFVSSALFGLRVHEITTEKGEHARCGETVSQQVWFWTRFLKEPDFFCSQQSSLGIFRSPLVYTLPSMPGDALFPVTSRAPGS